MTEINYAGYRFPHEIIHQSIWLYLRFTLSFRDVDDLLAERGIAVSYETVRRWVNHSGPRTNPYLAIHGLSPSAQPGRFHTRSNSHSVAVRDGCTNIPLAAGGARKDETILQYGFFGHMIVRFVRPDRPELIRFWKI
jgi:hypothetical protein